MRHIRAAEGRSDKVNRHDIAGTRPRSLIDAGSASSESPDDDVHQDNDRGSAARNEPEPLFNEVADRLAVTP